jgi:hypothetical protein
MLYYIKTGEISGSQHARNHKHAAMKLLENSDKDKIGQYIMVGTEKIKKETLHNLMCFSTESLICEISKKYSSIKLIY